MGVPSGDAPRSLRLAQTLGDWCCDGWRRAFVYGREAPTLAQLLERIAQLPEPQATEMLLRIRPPPSSMPPPESTAPAPPPLYTSWEDYLARTSSAERRGSCARKRKVANRERLMSGKPDSLLTVDDVWTVLETARGRCIHCFSLVLCEGSVVADHERIWAKHQTLADPQHLAAARRCIALLPPSCA
jgi:hypothetical protein